MDLLLHAMRYEDKEKFSPIQWTELPLWQDQMFMNASGTIDFLSPLSSSVNIEFCLPLGKVPTEKGNGTKVLDSSVMIAVASTIIEEDNLENLRVVLNNCRHSIKFRDHILRSIITISVEMQYEESINRLSGKFSHRLAYSISLVTKTVKAPPTFNPF